MPDHTTHHIPGFKLGSPLYHEYQNSFTTKHFPWALYQKQLRKVRFPNWTRNLLIQRNGNHLPAEVVVWNVCSLSKIWLNMYLFYGVKWSDVQVVHLIASHSKQWAVKIWIALLVKTWDIKRNYFSGSKSHQPYRSVKSQKRRFDGKNKLKLYAI